MSLNWPRCDCTRRCGCSGGHHSFGPYYQKLLEKVNPTKIFEWGPGLNTELALLFTQNIVSVEDVKKWMPDRLLKGQAIIFTRIDTEDYVQSVRHYADADIFFVDARRRSECLELVHKVKKPSAYVCLHDAQRGRYHNALSLYSEVEFPHKGFAICR